MAITAPNSLSRIQFKNKYAHLISALSKKLKISSKEILDVIEIETAGTFSPQVINPTSGATGLIQFMPDSGKTYKTINGVKYEIEDIYKMSVPEQWKVIEQYFEENFTNRGGSPGELYISVAAPSFVGNKDNDAVIYPANTPPATQNQNWTNDDGAVTVGSLKNFWNTKTNKVDVNNPPSLEKLNFFVNNDENIKNLYNQNINSRSVQVSKNEEYARKTQELIDVDANKLNNLLNRAGWDGDITSWIEQYGASNWGFEDWLMNSPDSNLKGTNYSDLEKFDGMDNWNASQIFNRYTGLHFIKERLTLKNHVVGNLLELGDDVDNISKDDFDYESWLYSSPEDLDLGWGLNIGVKIANNNLKYFQTFDKLIDNKIAEHRNANLDPTHLINFQSYLNDELLDVHGLKSNPFWGHRESTLSDIENYNNNVTHKNIGGNFVNMTVNEIYTRRKELLDLGARLVDKNSTDPPQMINPVSKYAHYTINNKKYTTINGNTTPYYGSEKGKEWQWDKVYGSNDFKMEYDKLGHYLTDINNHRSSNSKAGKDYYTTGLMLGVSSNQHKYDQPGGPEAEGRFSIDFLKTQNDQGVDKYKLIEEWVKDNFPKLVPGGENARFTKSNEHLEPSGYIIRHFLNDFNLSMGTSSINGMIQGTSKYIKPTEAEMAISAQHLDYFFNYVKNTYLPNQKTLNKNSNTVNFFKDNHVFNISEKARDKFFNGNTISEAMDGRSLWNGVPRWKSFLTGLGYDQYEDWIKNRFNYGKGDIANGEHHLMNTQIYNLKYKDGKADFLLQETINTMKDNFIASGGSWDFTGDPNDFKGQWDYLATKLDLTSMTNESRLFFDPFFQNFSGEGLIGMYNYRYLDRDFNTISDDIFNKYGISGNPFKDPNNDIFNFPENANTNEEFLTYLTNEGFITSDDGKYISKNQTLIDNYNGAENKEDVVFNIDGQDYSLKQINSYNTLYTSYQDLVNNKGYTEDFNTYLQQTDQERLKFLTDSIDGTGTDGGIVSGDVDGDGIPDMVVDDPGILSKIGGIPSIISAVMGAKAYADAKKDIEVDEYPELSETFKNAVRQQRELSKIGFSPLEERKVRKDISDAYNTATENLVRGTAGDRAKFLAGTGVIDAQRSSALLDFAAKDSALKRQNQDKYMELLKFKEEYDTKKDISIRNEKLGMELAKQQSSSQLAAASISSLLQNMQNAKLYGPGTPYDLMMQSQVKDMIGGSVIPKQPQNTFQHIFGTSSTVGQKDSYSSSILGNMINNILFPNKSKDE